MLTQQSLVHDNEERTHDRVHRQRPREGKQHRRPASVSPVSAHVSNKDPPARSFPQEASCVAALSLGAASGPEAGVCVVPEVPEPALQQPCRGDAVGTANEEPGSPRAAASSGPAVFLNVRQVLDDSQDVSGQRVRAVLDMRERHLDQHCRHAPVHRDRGVRGTPFEVTPVRSGTWRVDGPPLRSTCHRFRVGVCTNQRGHRGTRLSASWTVPFPGVQVAAAVAPSDVVRPAASGCHQPAAAARARWRVWGARAATPVARPAHSERGAAAGIGPTNGTYPSRVP